MRPKGATQDGLIKALDLTEIDSLIKTSSKAKNGFVPGRGRNICQNSGPGKDPTLSEE